MVEDASHMVMMERPDVVNEHILSFIGGDARSGVGTHDDGVDDISADVCFDEQRFSRVQTRTRSKSAKSIPSRFVSGGF